MPRNAEQQTDKRILTPTKALSQVSQGLTPAVPHPPQGRSPGGSNSIHWDAGSLPVSEPGWPVRVTAPAEVTRESQSSGIIWRSAPSTGCLRVCWRWDLPGMMSTTPNPRGSHPVVGWPLRQPRRALTGPQSDTVHCRSHGGPVQFFSARGRALASQSFSSSEQRMSLVTTLRSPQRAEHCREGTGTRRHPRLPTSCLWGWVFPPYFNIKLSKHALK